MEHFKVKQLKRLCKDANLKVSGNKQVLIDRLENHYAETSENSELKKRIRELESTIERLQIRSDCESESEFQPMTVSSPQSSLITVRRAEDAMRAQTPSNIAMYYAIAPSISDLVEDNTCWINNVSEQAPGITQDDRHKLLQLVASHKGCFAENINELGSCAVKKMNIKLNTEVLIKMKAYRIAFSLRQQVKKIIDELLQANIIRLSTSAYASRVVVVQKNNKELRLCVDYRQLNRVTQKEPHPMPVIDEQLALLVGNKYFTTLNLRMGYHQVQMEEDAKKYTAFVTDDGHYEYNRMPFGLVNAPALFQSIMKTIAARMGPGEVLTYLDDVVLPSKTIDEGLLRLEKFLLVLSEAGLTLGLDKCKFLAKSISYLGHEISESGITPGYHKLSAIRNFPVPKNVTDVRHFLGLTGFFRKFVRNYALICKPLMMLLRKSDENSFRWDEPQQQAFEKLIEALGSKPLLTIYDFNAFHEVHTEVHTDASCVGLAGVLLQSTDNKEWQPVFYFSRQCTESESHYHSYELEILAIVETLTRFRIYLLGKPFRLVTDGSAITTAKKKKELIPKIARWYMKLMEFDFEVTCRRSQKLAHLDAMSRAADEPACEVEAAGLIMSIQVADNNWLLTIQLQDVQLASIISILRGEKKSEQEKQIKTDYKLHNSRLYRKKNGLKLAVPRNVRWRIVKLCHDDFAHFGLEKTIARIGENFWFPRIRKYVREYIAACAGCCYYKAQEGKAEGQLCDAVIEPLPFTTLHIDHLGPFIKSARGVSHVLVIEDSFSKYVVIKPVRNTNTSPVITALNDLTCYFGVPKKLISDRGTAFTSEMFEDFCYRNNIQHVTTAVRTPMANGQAERANQLFLTLSKTSTDLPENWDLKLRELQWAINSQKNANSGFTPIELLFDFSLRDIVKNHVLAAVHDDQVKGQDIPIQEIRLPTAKQFEEEQTNWKLRFNNRHKKPTTYKVKDMVVIANEPSATDESRKLEPNFRGPYMVAKVLNNDCYLITDVPGIQTQRPFDLVYSADKMKHWCNNFPELDNNDDDTQTE